MSEEPIYEEFEFGDQEPGAGRIMDMALERDAFEIKEVYFGQPALSHEGKPERGAGGVA